MLWDNSHKLWFLVDILLGYFGKQYPLWLYKYIIHNNLTHKSKLSYSGTKVASNSAKLGLKFQKYADNCNKRQNPPVRLVTERQKKG